MNALMGGEFVGPCGGEPWNAWASWYRAGGMEIFQPIDLEKPVLGGHSGEHRGFFGMAFQVNDLDAEIPKAEAFGMRVTSRMGSEDPVF